MPSKIHPTAIIHPQAELGEDCFVGPYAVIGEDVRLGSRCRVDHHASLEGPTTIGADNHFFPFCSIGQKTQDLKYEGEPTYLVIGDHNVFREFVTVNRGTAFDSETVIGSHNHLLSYAHVAHDCRVGDRNIFSNNGTLAGHVVMGDNAIIGGLSAVHQFCRIGEFSIIGGCTKVVQDVPPYMIADGNPAKVRGINIVGLQRRGFAEGDIKALRRAFKILYDRNYNTTQALDILKNEFPSDDHIAHLIAFVHESSRGIIR